MQIGWFDWLALAILIAGIIVGRKRGMSCELLDVFQWLLIVVTAAHLYHPIGSLINSSSVFSPLFSYVTAYILVAVLVKAVFLLLKKALGGKLVGSDLFGRFEYYLGMVAGGIRFGCMMLAVLALLHAPKYSPEQLKRNAERQKENYGSISFPTLGSLQRDVFQNSTLGRFLEKELWHMLIQTTSSKGKSLRQREGPARRTEKVIEDFIPPNK
jgi:uncharacterized membrane protein required for colicin V production